MVRHIKLLPDAGSTTLSDQIIMFVSMPSDEPTGANGPNEYAPNRCGRRNSASLPGDPSLAAEARCRPGGNNHRLSGYAVRDGRLAAHRPPQQVPGQVCGGGHPCHFAGTEQTGDNPQENRQSYWKHMDDWTVKPVPWRSAAKSTARRRLREAVIY
jgi:hypothetical protein